MRVPSAGHKNNDYNLLRQKMLEKKAQESIQAQAPQDVQPPNGQTNGTKEQISQINGAQNPQGPIPADASAVGKKDPLEGMSTEAAGALQRQFQKDQETQSAAANMSNMVGATQQGDMNKHFLVNKKKEIEPQEALG